jgi:hypothetical protein
MHDIYGHGKGECMCEWSLCDMHDIYDQWNVYMYRWTYLTCMTYTVVERMQICGWNQLDCEMVKVDWCLPKDGERWGHFGMGYTWVVAILWCSQGGDHP